MCRRVISSLILLSVSGLFAAAGEPEPALQGGSYEITYRLELPHVERYAIDKTMTICLSHENEPVSTLPVLSENNPFGDCVAVNVRRSGTSLGYDLKCHGRDAAKAHATYTVSSGDFKGRVAMVMGAKNMTMTEIQSGHRLGSCEVTRASRD